jgi:hypothetical protein
MAVPPYRAKARRILSDLSDQSRLLAEPRATTTREATA